MPHKKRILYIEHYAGSPEMGMEFRPYYLSREWVKMGYRVDIIAADFSHLRIKNPAVEHDFQSEVIDGIHYHWIHTVKYEGNGIKRAVSMVQFVGKLWLHAKKIARKFKPDVIITSSTYPLDTYAGQRVMKYSFGRGKLIHEVHDLWPLTLHEVGGMSKKHPFYILMQIAEDSAYRHSDEVVSLVPLAKGYMMGRGMEEWKFRHIPNGISGEEWSSPWDIPPEHQNLLQKLRQEKRFVVGYFGGHAISNNIDLILDTAKLTDDFIAFVLVGDGVEKPRLRERKEAEGIDNVYFLPPIGKRAVPNFLEYVDCSIMVSQKSNLYRFGLCMNKIFDSMMGGRPIICAIPTPDTIISGNQCGQMVGSQKPEHIRKAIYVYRDMEREELERIGENGRKAAQNRYNYQTLAADFANLFE